ncbi:O-antigen ligase family protein [Patescibacteria group bacterium]
MILVKILFYTLLLILPFGQLVKLPINISEVNVYLYDIVVFLIFAIWGIRKFFIRKQYQIPPLFRSILAFILIALFSLILSIPYFENRELAVAFLYLLRFTLYSTLYLVLVDIKGIKGASSFVSKVKDLFLLGICFTAFLGLLQYIFIPDVSSLKAFNWDPHYYRLIGTFLDPGFTGMILVFGLVLVILKFWPVKKNLSFIGITVFGFLYLALALTYARSAYLAFAVAVLAIALIKKSLKFLSFITMLGFITVLILPRPGGEGVRLERKSSSIARIDNWQKTLSIAFDKPLFGIGFNNYRYKQRDLGLLNKDNWQQSHAGSGSDSSLFFILATSGFLGLIAYLWLIAKIFKISFQQKSTVVISSLLALLVHSFFNNSLFYAWNMIIMWIIIGINLEN